MKLSQCLLLSAACVLVLGGTAKADTKVELKGVHICCGACVKAVGGVLKDAGATGAKCDQKAKTVTFSAADDKAAQKAVDALAAAGFHGDSGSKDIVMKDDSGAKKGNVKTLSLTAIHNCCGSCCKAIKDTVKKVDGVKADTAKPKEADFTVTGDFDAAALVKALNDAGFHVKVKE
jgi:mercuric ion binding protein